MLIVIFFTKFVKMNLVQSALQEQNNDKTNSIETKQDSQENQIYQILRFPNKFNLWKKRRFNRNSEPVCRPVCEPRFRFRNRHEFDIRSESDSGSRPECRPICRPRCRPECRPRFKFNHPRRRKNHWRPRCRPICGQSSESHSSSISYSRDSSSSEVSNFIDCREREPVCRPVCEEQFRIMSYDQKHRRKLAPVCKPICRPKSTHRSHKHIKRRWEELNTDQSGNRSVNQCVNQKGTLYINPKNIITDQRIGYMFLNVSRSVLMNLIDITNHILLAEIAKANTPVVNIITSIMNLYVIL